MDIKKALFNYGDKAIFLIFLLLFLLSAFKLVSNQDPGRIPNPQGSFPKGGDSDILIQEDSHILRDQIRSPLICDAGGGISTDPDEIEPGKGEKSCPQCSRIVPIELEICPKCGYEFNQLNDTDRDGLDDDWEIKYFGDLTQGSGDDFDKDGYSNLEEFEGNSDPTDAASIPRMFVIAEIGQVPVDIFFDGYIVHEGGDSNKPDPAFWDLQINWGKGAKTKIIPYGGYFHGYRLYPLEMKKEKVWKDSLEDFIEYDVWFLTIQKKGRQPIVVRIRTEARENEFYVRLRVTRGIDKGKTTERLYDTEKFTANDKEYTVLRIAEKEVKLLDEKDNIITLKKN